MQKETTLKSEGADFEISDQGAVQGKIAVENVTQFQTRFLVK
jgi:hypothetical protein